MRELLFMFLYARPRTGDGDGASGKAAKTCRNAAADHFYHIILWAQVCKCVTCLCFSGYVPVPVKGVMKRSRMGEKRIKTAFRAKKKKE